MTSDRGSSNGGVWRDGPVERFKDIENPWLDAAAAAVFVVALPFVWAWEWWKAGRG